MQGTWECRRFLRRRKTETGTGNLPRKGNSQLTGHDSAAVFAAPLSCRKGEAGQRVARSTISEETAVPRLETERVGETRFFPDVLEPVPNAVVEERPPERKMGGAAFWRAARDVLSNMLTSGAFPRSSAGRAQGPPAGERRKADLRMRGLSPLPESELVKCLSRQPRGPNTIRRAPCQRRRIKRGTPRGPRWLRASPSKWLDCGAFVKGAIRS